MPPQAVPAFVVVQYMSEAVLDDNEGRDLRRAEAEGGGGAALRAAFLCVSGLERDLESLGYGPAGKRCEGYRPVDDE